MSTDKLDRVTAIASRQPAICPARHQVSPAVLEYRLQQVEKERDALLACLRMLADSCDTGARNAKGRQVGVRVPDKPVVDNARALLAKIGGG